MPDGTPRPVTALTSSQLLIQSWFIFYDWVLSGEGPPVPDLEILNNDRELDEYIADWKADQKKKRDDANKQSRGSGKSHSNHFAIDK